MKTTINIYYAKVSVKGVTHRQSNIVMASCKSEPAHIMDCERLLAWNSYTPIETDLESFIKRLKTVVYEDELLETNVIDNREFDLPVYIV